MTTSTCRLRSAQSRRATLVTHCCCGRVRVASRHWGRASEAGAQRLYVKFGAVRPGAGADEHFDALLNACSALAHEVGMTTVVAGVNLARENAYHQMCNRGFLCSRSPVGRAASGECLSPRSERRSARNDQTAVLFCIDGDRPPWSPTSVRFAILIARTRPKA
jgi:hypothetical protein